MKNCFAILITMLFFTASPAVADTFSPVPSPNPWVDDYEALAPAEHYLSWGTYNIHDPSIRFADGYYYMYTTDAMYRTGHRDAKRKGIDMGFIPIRRSKDLVNWEFVGWVFPTIPSEAVEWVRSHAGPRSASNIWAPFFAEHDGVYRLYYCVSAFGKNTSYIGLAEATSPAGPWTDRGCVVKTDRTSAMNAIDPSVIEDADGRWWMHYGSYFGGLFCVELDPATGFTKRPGDQGHITTSLANYKSNNLEAPEVMYNPANKQYYLFVSYGPLMSNYNVRVGRSPRAEEGYTDFFGKEMVDTTDNYPILTTPYRFDSHKGWAGTAHCTVFDDGQGRYFMAHQGRLAPDNMKMCLHLREMFFTPSGWPVVSPERYAGTPSRHFTAGDLAGEWEVMRVRELASDDGVNTSEHRLLSADGTVGDGGNWRFAEKGQLLTLELDGETVGDLVVFAGHDWERETATVLFTGLDASGRSVWGKRVK